MTVCGKKEKRVTQFFERGDTVQFWITIKRGMARDGDVIETGIGHNWVESKNTVGRRRERSLEAERAAEQERKHEWCGPVRDTVSNARCW